MATLLCRSSVAVSSTSTSFHSMTWPTATDERQRRVKEALYIRMAPPGVRMNRDEGREVSPLWLNAIRKLRRTQGDQKTIQTGPVRMLQPNPPATEDRRQTFERVVRHTPGRGHAPWTRTLDYLRTEFVHCVCLLALTKIAARRLKLVGRL